MKQLNTDHLRHACRVASETLAYIARKIAPGMTTNDINRLVHEDTLRRGGYPAPLNYRGYPKSVCTSVNDVVCHGIPGALVLKEGDIINVDVTTVVNGHFGDCSATFPVGACDEKATALYERTHLMLNCAVAVVEPGAQYSAIGRRIEEIANDYGYGIVKEFCGHGIGTRFHTLPNIIHYASDDEETMKPGDVFTIEPMINMGGAATVMDDDGWTVRTCDGSLSAQFEYTVLVTETGHEVLTPAMFVT